jgi:hypothetical protein
VSYKINSVSALKLAEDWATTVEGFAPGILPECFDVVGFVADKAGDVAVESAFDGFGVALWGCG